MGLVDGHRAVVTGGGSGIGRATCRRLTEEGARVAVLDRDEALAKEVAASIGGVAFGVDVADPGAVSDAVDGAAEELGVLSIVFANAGIGTMACIGEMSAAEWRRILSVDLDGVFHTVHAALPHLLAGGDGRIVSTASISGVRPAEGEAAYSAAKAGVAAFTASLALEYAPVVRANAVSPGMIATTLTGPLLEFPEIVDRMLAKTPVARIGEPEDIADVVVFLCSDLARFVTGQNLVVDGGMTLHGSGVDGLFRYFVPAGPGVGSNSTGRASGPRKA
ncbi:MAG TPA: SDR family NAD(P)-dependent oxidoreductase [Acidimicrobiales bacterium]